MTNKYYQKHKEKLQREARAGYQNFSEKEKDKRWKKETGLRQISKSFWREKGKKSWLYE